MSVRHNLSFVSRERFLNAWVQPCGEESEMNLNELISPFEHEWLTSICIFVRKAPRRKIEDASLTRFVALCQQMRFPKNRF